VSTEIYTYTEIPFNAIKIIEEQLTNAWNFFKLKKKKNIQWISFLVSYCLRDDLN
jgi:hypothetical protein